MLANPPFSLEQWGRELWESDPWGRAFAGLPTDSNGDMAWVQHMVKSMASRTGRMGVVLPQGALFRGGVEAQIRKHLLDQDLIEAVIGLAPNLFYGTGLAACVLLLRQKKAKVRQGKVLVVDASSVSVVVVRRTFWTRSTASKSWAGCSASPMSKIAPASTRRRDRKRGLYAQHLARYVLPPIGADIPPLPDAVAAFKESLQKCREAEDNLRRVMQEGGWLS